jgi:uncharacterized membrane protein YgcG
MLVRYLSFLVFSLLLSNAFGQGYYIKNFNIDVNVKQDGYVDVEETITVEFETSKRGIIRNIPFRFKIDGKEYKTKISSIKVPGYKKDVTTHSNDLSIRIGDPDVYLTGQQVYKITYTVKKPFLIFEDYTEFYWNLTGNEWDTRIDNVGFSVSFDKDIPLGSGDFKGFAGAFGDVTPINYLEVEGKVLRGAHQGLGVGQGATVAVKLPNDFLIPPTALEAWLEKYGKILLASIYSLFFGGLFYHLWKKYGKDYDTVVAAKFMPPDGLNPAEVGAIVDEKIDNIDVVSLIPYWAHNGHLRIKHIPIRWGKDDYELERLTPISEDAHNYEKNLFYHLFSSGNKVLLSSLKESFYTHMNSAKDGLKGRIKQMEVYYSASDNMQIIVGVLTFVQLFIGFFIGLVTANFLLIGGVILTSIAGLVATIYMRKKTHKGIDIFQEVIGFREFVKTADKPRIERLLKDDPMYFEKTLPYAMVFGYAKKWGDKFDGLMTEPPSWYVGSGPYMHGHMFNSGGFARDFEGGMREVQSAFTSMPESSGGGSFGGGGGGGFSGGGFGGGGGSSW